MTGSDEPGHNSADPKDMVGKLLANKYELLEHVGSGGMGVVYKARNIALGTIVSVKLLQQQIFDEPGALRRLKQEAKTLATMDHPNILRVFALDRDDQQIFIVTEFIDGRSLSEILAQPGKLDDERITTLYRQIGQALKYAHSRGVIHRDIKPSNFLVSTTSGAESVKILDFGVAKVLDADTFQRLTRTGAMVGTPLYMSPEQCRGDAVDARSDIYSLGCMLYETLSGSPPFSGETPLDVMYKHLNDTVPQLGSTRLGPVAVRAMEKDPIDRFQSVDEFLAALSAPFQASLKRRRSAIKRGRRAPLVTTALLIMVLMGATFQLTRQNPAETNDTHKKSHMELLVPFYEASRHDWKWNWKNIDEQLLELSNRDLNERQKADLLGFQGLRHQYLERLPEANSCYQQAIVASRQAGFSSPLALGHLTNNMVNDNRVPEAIALAEQELAFVQNHPQMDRHDKINVYHILSKLYKENQFPLKAVVLQDQIRKVFTHSGTLADALAVCESARCYELNSQSAKALHTLDQWDKSHGQTADIAARAEAALTRAEIYITLKNHTRAMQILIPLEKELWERKSGNVGRHSVDEAIQRERARVLLHIGSIYFIQGDKRALPYIEKAQAEAAKMNKTNHAAFNQAVRRLHASTPTMVGK